MTWLLGYLILGALVAHANDRLVVRDHTGGPAERANFFARCMLAWPTYVLEDCWLNGDDSED